jgi:hypothetical protein
MCVLVPAVSVNGAQGALEQITARAWGVGGSWKLGPVFESRLLLHYPLLSSRHIDGAENRESKKCTHSITVSLNCRKARGL